MGGVASVPETVAELQSSSPEVRARAAEALAKLADNTEHRDELGSLPGSLQSLLVLLHDSSVDVRQHSAQALANVTFQHHANATRVSNSVGALEGLVRLLGDKNEGVRRNAARALGNIAMAGDDNKAQLAEVEGVFEAFITSLSDENSSVKRNTARALGLLVSRQHQASQKVEGKVSTEPSSAETTPKAPIPPELVGKAVDALSGLLSDQSGEVRQHAARALGFLAAESAENSNEIGQTANIIEQLVAMLADPTTEVRHCAATTLADLAANSPTNKEKITNTPNAVVSLLDLLNTLNVKIQVRVDALNALTQLAIDNDTARDFIAADPSLSSGIGEVLKSVEVGSRTGDTAIAEFGRHGVLAASLFITDENREAFGTNEAVVKGLLDSLLDDFVEVRANALDAIGRLVYQSDEISAKFLSADSLKIVVQLMAEENDDVCNNAVRLVSLLSFTSKENSKFVGSSPDALAQLLRLCTHDWDEVRQQAAATLSILAFFSADNAVRIGQIEGSVEILVDLLSDESPLSRQHAVIVIGNLAVRDPANTKHIATTPGALESLVALLNDPTAEIRRHAARAIGNLAFEHEAVKNKICGLDGAIEGLVRLLCEGDTDSKCHSARTLADLATNASDSNKTRIAHDGIVGLVALLADEKSECRHNAARCIGVLAYNNDDVKSLISETPEALQNLVSILADDAPVAQYSARALGDIALNHGGNCEKIGAIPELPEKISKMFATASAAEENGGQTELRRNAARLISVLTQENSSNRKLFGGNVDVVGALVASLGDFGVPVRMNALTAIGNLAADPTNRESLSQSHPNIIPGLVAQLSQPELRISASVALAMLCVGHPHNAQILGSLSVNL